MTTTFNIEFDYRFVPTGVFSDIDKAHLEEAARIWESFITDSFREIPAGTTIRVSNPQTDEDDTESFVLTEPLGDLRIFLAAKPIDPAAYAGPRRLFVEETASTELTADELNVEITEGFTGTDFEPRIGMMTFDVDEQSNTNVSVALALHEMGHILGIGSNNVFRGLVNDNLLFEGENATALNNGQPIPILSRDEAHIDEGFTLADGINPVVGPGVGDGLPTVLDLAVLSDIGWEIPVITEREAGLPTLDYVRQGTVGNDYVFYSSGSDGGEPIFITAPLYGHNGDDIIFGNQGDDTLIGSYLRSSGNIAVITRNGVAEVIFDYLQPDDGNDQLFGEAGDDELFGNTGDDFLHGGIDNDQLRGDGGQDTFVFDVGSGVDTIEDFVVADDSVQVSKELGFRESSELLAALSDPITQEDGRFLSTLDLSTEDQVNIYHDAPIAAENFVISESFIVGRSLAKSNAAQLLDITPSGLALPFDQALNLDSLNLYQGQNSAAELPDFTLVGEQAGEINGSLVWDNNTNTLTFVKTGLPLVADNYTLTLASRENGFVFGDGNLLDGNGNGEPGGDFTASFAMTSRPGRILSLPDFTRSVGQAVNVPATTMGLPLKISDATDVQTIDLTLTYNPDLLNVTGVSLDANLPESWQVNSSNFDTPGQAVISLGGTDSLTGGETTLAYFDAIIPDTASNGDSGILELESVQINDGAISVFGDAAVQQIAAFGDATGNGELSGLDASLIARVAVGLDNGFDAFPRTDPMLLGDTTGNGELSGLDASFVARKAVGLPQPEIPV